MDASDSENEGQLLIDESVDTSKKSKATRKRGPKGKPAAPNKKKALKLVVRANPAQSRGRKPKGVQNNDENIAEANVTSTRASTRVRKRVRKHSPSPVRSKQKEPPKKKLKVKIKNLSKKVKISAPKVNDDIKDTKEKISSDDFENVDIESVSDEELSDVQYSSVLVDEDPSEKAKKVSKVKQKTGIKLKLSLGKVLTSKIAESITVKMKDAPDSNDLLSEPAESLQPKENTIKPLIISKRRVSSEIIVDDAVKNAIFSDNTIDDALTGNESPYYSSSAEDHKPLTLRLSVGKPKILNRSISEFKGASEAGTKLFPNIKRSWSIAPPIDDVKPDEITSSLKLDNDKVIPRTKKEITSADLSDSSSKTPYFNAGLQSLLDVVSVEIKEQNGTHSNVLDHSNLGKVDKKPSNQHPLSSMLYLNSSKSPTLKKSLSFEGTPSNHEGHLPSLAFPKPSLHFSSKKRPRIKSVTNVSPQRPTENNVEVKGQLGKKEIDDEIPNPNLTEKERRRREKKKTLNPDFVDPDSVISGSEIGQTKPKKKPVLSYVPKTKAGGLSLLMPQITMKPDASEPKLVHMAGTCNLPNRPVISKKPRKGLATTKQRLANKLKIRKTFAF